MPDGSRPRLRALVAVALICIGYAAGAWVGTIGIRLLHAGPLRLDTFRQVALLLLFVGFPAPFLSSFLDAGFVALSRFGSNSYWQVL